MDEGRGLDPPLKKKRVVIVKNQDSSSEAGEKAIHYYSLWGEKWSGEAEGLEGCLSPSAVGSWGLGIRVVSASGGGGCL